MPFILAERDQLKAHITFRVGDPRQADSVFPESPLKDFPQFDALNARLHALRQTYRETVHIRHQIYPENTYMSRIIQYLENHAYLLPYDFPDQHSVAQHKPGELPGGVMQIATLCREILTKGRDDVIWEESLNPLVRDGFVDKRLRVNSAVIFKPHSQTMKIGDDLTLNHQFIHRRKDKETNYYEFDDPNTFYALISYYYTRNFKGEELLRELKADGFFDKNNLARVLPVLSYIAEELFVRYPNPDFAHFEKFILDLPDKIGEAEGFSASAAIAEDLIMVYRSFFARGNNGPLFTKEKLDILQSIPDKLRKSYDIWKYRIRPIVIPQAIRAQAHRRMLAEEDPKQGYYEFLEAVFAGIGARARFPELLDEKDIEPIRWIFERALNKKKMEAGQIPIIADILGYPDQETLIWITNLTQLLWAAILDGDDTTDQSPTRGNDVSLYIREGMADGIQKPLLTILKATRKIMERRGINNTALGQGVLTMLDELYTGDIQSRELGFGYGFSYYETYMRRIMQVLAWSPRFMAESTGMNLEAADSLARYMENYGCLILMLDDFKDVADDIGSRVSIFMNGLVKCEDIPVSLRNRFVEICYDRVLNKKRKSFQPLNKAEQQKVARAVDIANRHRHTVTQFLMSEISYYYNNALAALDEISKQLPSDTRNMYYLLLFRKNAREILKAFQSF